MVASTFAIATPTWPGVNYVDARPLLRRLCSLDAAPLMFSNKRYIDFISSDFYAGCH